MAEATNTSAQKGSKRMFSPAFIPDDFGSKALVKGRQPIFMSARFAIYSGPQKMGQYAKVKKQQERGPMKRRKFSKEFKARVALEAIKGQHTANATLRFVCAAQLDR